MTFTQVPWLELAVAVSLIGAICIARVRDPLIASNWCIAFAGFTLVITLASWVAFVLDPAAVPHNLLTRIYGRTVFSLDQLSAPLVSGVAFLNLLIVLSTSRTKMPRYSFSISLIGNAIRISIFCCINPYDLGILLAVAVIPPYFELRSRKRPTGVYVSHMAFFLIMLAGGLLTSGTFSALLLMIAVLARSGTVPLHTWVVDLFENVSMGTALMVLAPITGMYAALRLVLPVAPPDWILQGIGITSLITAVYAAGMAIIATNTRRYLAYLILSNIGLVMVGMELHTSISMTGALSLWASSAVSLVGLGLMIRALEARFERVSLTEFRGLYATSPTLAIGFLLTGIASVGFPGTSGFIALEMLVDGAMTANPAVGVTVVIATALNGVAVMRAYFLIFTGKNPRSSVHLHATVRERIVYLSIAVLVLSGGLLPQFLIANRHSAAEVALDQRHVVPK